MQLMPATARSVAKERREVYGGISSLYDPPTNIALGATYYVNLLSRFDGNRVKALAAYNAGPHRVVEYSGIPPFIETRDYIARIHRIRSRLAGPPASAPDIRVANQVPARAPVLIELQ